MHLEISARQSGKTKRLIDHLVKEFKRYSRRGWRYNAMVVTLNFNMVKIIREEFSRRLLAEIGTHVVPGSVTFTTYKNFPESVRGKVIHAYYFDEFDHAGKLDVRYFVLNGRYYTSPAFIRTRKYLKKYTIDSVTGHAYDLLVELVRFKRYKYRNFVNLDIVDDMKKRTPSRVNDVFGIWREPYAYESLSSRLQYVYLD